MNDACRRASYTGRKDTVMLTEYLYQIGLQHKDTGEYITVEVWADTNEHATNKLLKSLIGYDTQYLWTGTSPVHVDNHVLERKTTRKRH